MAISVAILVLLVMSFREVRAQGQFVGSVNSDVYHYPWCRYVSQIKPENLIWFTDASDAISHGYRPCLVCNPPIPEMSPTCLVVAFAVVTSVVLLLKKKEFETNT